VEFADLADNVGEARGKLLASETIRITGLVSLSKIELPHPTTVITVLAKQTG